MVVNLEKMLNENGSMFNKQHHVPCMVHFLNLVIQGGLTSEYSKGEDDEGCDKDVLEVSFKRAFGKILPRL